MIKGMPGETKARGFPRRARIFSFPLIASLFLLGLLLSLRAADLDTIIKEAEAGNAESQALLGLKYDSGDGVSENRELARQWWKRSADQENATGQLLLGWSMLCEVRDGVITIQKNEDGVSLVRKAAEGGHPAGMSKLGFMYEQSRVFGLGSGTLPLAVEWYRKAAQKGHAGAMVSVGDILMEDPLGPFPELRNASEALLWYEKAAELGNIRAQYTLGEIYLKGRQIPASGPAALKWLSLAAGNSLDETNRWTILSAFRDLARIHEDGKLVPVDVPTAIHWYEKASREGDDLAQARLGRIHSAGKGIPVDLGEAYVWFSLAIENGNKGSVLPRFEVEKKMSVTDHLKAKYLLFQRRAMIRKRKRKP